MASGSSLIETGVDKLVTLVNNAGKISIGDAAKELGVSSGITKEWAEFLEEEGIISIEYKLTKTFLVARTIAKKDVTKKHKEYVGKKDIFVRKAEVSLGFLEKEAGKLNGIKEEFDKIKKELGFDLDSVKKELEELEKYEHLKIDLDNQIRKQRTTSMGKIHSVAKQISDERKKYSGILDAIQKEELELKKEQERISNMKDMEDHISKKLSGLRKTIDEIEKKVRSEEDNVSIHERNVKKLSGLAEDVKKHMERELEAIEPLIKESLEQESKIKEVQKQVVSKLSEKEKKMKSAQNASKKIKDLFGKKMKVINFIEKINQDRDELRKDLNDLIKKARSFEISAKSRDVAGEVTKLEDKFSQVDKKRKVFEKELKKLSSFFK